MKYILIWLLLCSAALPVVTFAQDDKSAQGTYYLDSVYMSFSRISETDPQTISFISIYKIADTVDSKIRAGKVYAFTKHYVRDQCWRFFSSRSEAYKSLVPAPEADTNLHYILNGQVLEEGARSKLFPIINDKSFLGLKIIDSKQLLKEYHIRTQSMGVVVNAKIKKEE